MNLELSTETRAGLPVLIAAGEVDAYTAPALRQELLETIGAGAGPVLLDLDGVGFLDSTGLGVLVGAYQQAQREQQLLALVGTNPRVLRLLELTGLTRLFTVFPDAAAAAAQLAPARP